MEPGMINLTGSYQEFYQKLKHALGLIIHKYVFFRASNVTFFLPLCQSQKLEKYKFSYHIIRISSNNCYNNNFKLPITQKQYVFCTYFSLQVDVDDSSFLTLLLSICSFLEHFGRERRDDHARVSGPGLKVAFISSYPYSMGQDWSHDSKLIAKKAGKCSFSEFSGHVKEVNELLATVPIKKKFLIFSPQKIQMYYEGPYQKT